MINPGFFSKYTVRMPVAVLISLMIIVAIGILNLSSAAQATHPDLYLSQLSKFGLALGAMLLTGVIHTRIIRRFSFSFYIVAIVLLVLVMLVGYSAKGGQRWLVLGAFRLQPSDPAKIALILAMARYCSLYWPHRGYTLLGMLKPFNFSRPLGFLASIVFLLVKDRHDSSFFPPEFLRSTVGVGIMGSLLMIGSIWLLISIIMFM